MSTQKSTTPTLRINPVIKAGLKAAAEHKHCSITNMVEVLVRDYCQKNLILLDADKSQLTLGNK